MENDNRQDNDHQNDTKCTTVSRRQSTACWNLKGSCSNDDGGSEPHDDNDDNEHKR